MGIDPPEAGGIRTLVTRISSGRQQKINRLIFCQWLSRQHGGLGKSRGVHRLQEVRKTTLTAALLAAADRDRSQQEIEAALRQELAAIAGARFTVGGSGAGEKVPLVLAADDEKSLIATARRAMTDLRTLPDLGNITSSASLVRPEVIIRLDFARAAELGVSAEDLGEAIRVATTGD